MQPARVQIGMNSAVILLILLLAVPLQLFFAHYISKSYEEEQPGSRDGENEGPVGVQAARAEALDMLGEAMGSLMERVSYYSTPANLKEFFLVPFKKKSQQGMKIKASKSDKGFTTITIETGSNPDSNNRGTKSGTTSDKTAALQTPPSSQQQQQKTKSKASEPEMKEEPTSVAKEVNDYLFNEVYFAQSKKPRDVKSRHIAFSIGQVVRHIQDGYYGVIIGWDPVAKAPEAWLQRHYTSERQHEVLDGPHYLVLVDSRFDASANPFHYLPQADIEIITDIQVHCLEMKKFFEGYNNGRHIPRPWLQTLYPRDGA